MKYEKFLLQVNQAMMHDFEKVQCYAGDCRTVEGNIFRQAETVGREIWNIEYVSTKSLENYSAALDIPKDFIEKSKATTWLAILNSYKKQ